MLSKREILRYGRLKKMFYQIMMREEDRGALRFMW